MTHRYDPSTTKIDSLRRNCTLVAVREVTGKTDEEILRAFLARDYRWNRGTFSNQYIGAIKDLGFEVERVSVAKDNVLSPRDAYVTVDTGRENRWGNPILRTTRQSLTVGAFARKHKKGTFVVSDGGHAFVLRDGVVVDPNLERRGQMRRRKLHDAYRIVNPALSRKLTATRLKRNSDPVVRFAPIGKTKKIRPVELEARRYYNEEARNRHVVGLDGVVRYEVRLSEIVANTGYTRYDAAWDVRRGRLIIVKP